MTVAMKTILITGAAQGVGLTTAALLAQRGCRVMLVDTQPLGEQVARLKAAGGQAEGISGDISSEEFVQQLADRISRDYGALEGLVNNAGISLGGQMLARRRGSNGITLPVDGGWLADGSWNGLRLGTRA
jgi:NAD(P)-dependent dehydrogenase (short-subunit alcohol dehydrogenase family)